MPFKKSPPKLQQLCFNAIADNFDALRFQVSALPYLFINKLYENRYTLKTQHPLLATIFINPGTKKLQLLKEFIHSNWVLNRIQTHCINLTYLDLTDMIEILPKQLSRLVKHLPKLKEIVLSGTNCDDLVVKSIARNCRKLRHLDVSGCDVSNTGIIDLCARNSSIEGLDVTRTNVTADCCLQVLDNVENLKEFAHSNWANVYQMLKQRFYFHRIWRTYNLQILSDFDQEMTISELKINALSIFPKLRRFVIGIHYYVFKIDIYPPLRDAGKGLTSLQLRFANVDIDVIGNSCPNLDTLELYHCTKALCNHTKSIETFIPLFPKLRALDLRFSFADIVTLLVSAPNLQGLILVSCLFLIDDPLTLVLDSNGLQQLQELRVENCDEITSSGLMKLLMMRNILNILDIYECRNVNEKDFQEMCTYIEEKNLDVLVNYYDDNQMNKNSEIYYTFESFFALRLRCLE